MLFTDSFCLFSYTVQDHLPKGSIIHSELGSLTYRQISQRHFLKWDSFFPDDPSLGQAAIKTKEESINYIASEGCLLKGESAPVCVHISRSSQCVLVPAGFLLAALSHHKTSRLKQQLIFSGSSDSWLVVLGWGPRKVWRQVGLELPDRLTELVEWCTVPAHIWVRPAEWLASWASPGDGCKPPQLQEPQGTAAGFSPSKHSKRSRWNLQNLLWLRLGTSWSIPSTQFCWSKSEIRGSDWPDSRWGDFTRMWVLEA